MSERYKPKNLIRARSAEITVRGDSNELSLPAFKPKPREQIVYRNGKPVVLAPVMCRLHNQPWQTCELCSKASKR